jgi:hypothetical protein
MRRIAGLLRRRKALVLWTPGTRNTCLFGAILLGLTGSAAAAGELREACFSFRQSIIEMGKDDAGAKLEAFVRVQALHASLLGAAADSAREAATYHPLGDLPDLIVAGILLRSNVETLLADEAPMGDEHKRQVVRPTIRLPGREAVTGESPLNISVMFHGAHYSAVVSREKTQLGEGDGTSSAHMCINSSTDAAADFFGRPVTYLTPMLTANFKAFQAAYNAFEPPAGEQSWLLNLEGGAPAQGRKGKGSEGGPVPKRATPVTDAASAAATAAAVTAAAAATAARVAAEQASAKAAVADAAHKVAAAEAAARAKEAEAATKAAEAAAAKAAEAAAARAAEVATAKVAEAATAKAAEAAAAKAAAEEAAARAAALTAAEATAKAVADAASKAAAAAEAEGATSTTSALANATPTATAVAEAAAEAAAKATADAEAASKAAAGAVHAGPDPGAGAAAAGHDADATPSVTRRNSFAADPAPSITGPGIPRDASGKALPAGGPATARRGGSTRANTPAASRALGGDDNTGVAARAGSAPASQAK